MHDTKQHTFPCRANVLTIRLSSSSDAIIMSIPTCVCCMSPTYICGGCDENGKYCA